MALVAAPLLLGAVALALEAELHQHVAERDEPGDADQDDARAQGRVAADDDQTMPATRIAAGKPIRKAFTSRRAWAAAASSRVCGVLPQRVVWAYSIRRGK